MDQTFSGPQLRSLLHADGRLELSLVEVDTPAPRDDEVVVALEAAPINPSDLGLLLGAADLETGRATGPADRPVLTFDTPPAALRAMAGRLDQSLPVGNEGAGRVVAAAGASEAAKALLGRTVAALGGAMYARHRRVKAADCLPASRAAAEGASAFVNPLTALGMVETMRAEGHSALVHTAAASNLGRMLNRLCQAEGVPLVNVVRSPEQAAVLHEEGAVHVCDSSDADFGRTLADAVAGTGATLAFDAIGGGRLAGRILAAMEAAAVARPSDYSRYGSTVHKQVYIYGALDTGPTELNRSFGFAWGVGGWLLTPFLQKAGAARTAALKARVAAELSTTFQSRYTATLSLAEALTLDAVRAYARRATGGKYLIDPSR